MERPNINYGDVRPLAVVVVKEKVIRGLSTDALPTATSRERVDNKTTAISYGKELQYTAQNRPQNCGVTAQRTAPKMAARRHSSKDLNATGNTALAVHHSALSCAITN